MKPAGAWIQEKNHVKYNVVPPVVFGNHIYKNMTNAGKEFILLYKELLLNRHYRGLMYAMEILGKLLKIQYTLILN